MQFSRIASGYLAVGAALLIAAPVALWAQSDDDRRRAVGDWLVEDVAEADGTRAIHLVREEGDYRIDYHMWLRPGPTVPDAHGFEVDRFNCAQGMEETTEGDQATKPEAAPVRARLVDYLEHCAAPAADVDALFQGYDRAFALARSWADERLARMTAEAEAGSGDMGLDMNAADNMSTEMMGNDMTMFPDATDMNATAIDANAYDAAANALEAVSAAANAAVEAAENGSADPQ